MTSALRVVIVGAGFGGLSTARALSTPHAVAGRSVEVVVVDRRNHHTFQPLLYQVATAGLDGESIAHPVRGIFHGRPNVRARLGTVCGADWSRRELLTAEGQTVPFDRVVLAPGAVSSSFGVPGVDEHAFALKSLTDALTLRTHILEQFESADVDPSVERAGGLTFVIVGGGPTGVEMAGALVELFRMVLAKDFPDLDLTRARVVLVEALDRLIGAMHPSLGEHARRTLEARGVEVLLGRTVEAVDAEAVRLDGGTVIATRTLVWATGVRPHPLVAALGLPLDSSGRVCVGPDLRVEGRPDVFVIGDAAGARDRHGRAYPQLAPVAMQQGRHVAREIIRSLDGRRPRRFRYFDKGTMATIGRNSAVAELPLGLRFRGFVAWLMWLGLHLVYLIGFRNRTSVLLDWAWNYVTYDRGARLIFEPPPARDPPGRGLPL
jgi:NADH:quinone reductase (non-electrogenic)